MVLWLSGQLVTQSDLEVGETISPSKVNRGIVRIQIIIETVIKSNQSS
jgi:hypothetical protein